MKVLIIEQLVTRIKALIRRTPVKEKTKTIRQEEIAEISRAPAAPKLEAEAVLPHKVSEPEIVSAQPTPALTLEEVATRIWGNAQTMALLDALQKGKLIEINPVLELSLKDGFTYPEADEILGTSGRATTRILESLAEEDILLNPNLTPPIADAKLGEETFHYNKSL
jgi:hypothetical protein